MGNQLVSKEKLALQSEEELEELFKEKTAEYKKKLAKNRRIRAMLVNKVEKQQEIVNVWQKDLDEFIANNPNIVKVPFDDTEVDTELENQVREENRTLQNSINLLEKRKLELNKAYHQLKIKISGLEAQKIQVQEEVSTIDTSLKRLASEGSEAERLELAKLESKFNMMQNEMEELSQELTNLQEHLQVQKDG